MRALYARVEFAAQQALKFLKALKPSARRDWIAWAVGLGGLWLLTVWQLADERHLSIAVALLRALFVTCAGALAMVAFALVLVVAVSFCGYRCHEDEA